MTVILWAVAVVAARGRSFARLLDLRVPFQRTLPALMSLPGHKASHEAKWEAVGHFERSLPISPKRTSTMVARPGICVTSTPNNDSFDRDRTSVGAVFKGDAQPGQTQERGLGLVLNSK